MDKSKDNIDILLDQRHFSFVLLKDVHGFSIADYWSLLSKEYTLSDKYVLSKNDIFDVEMATISMSEKYVRAGLLQKVSIKNDGNPPYVYEIYALKIYAKNDAYIVLLYPSVLLAKKVTKYLITNNLLRYLEFYKTDLDILCKNNDSMIDNDIYPILSKIVDMKITIHNEDELSSVILKGDAPIKSFFYKNNIIENLIDHSFVIEYCSLLCNVESPQLAINDNYFSNKSRARISLDAFGNFKIYVHVGCENIFVIPYFVLLLISLRSLKRVSINPMNRNTETEE